VLIRVDLGDDGIQTIRVQATGIPQTRLIALKPVITFDDSGNAEFTVTALTYGSEQEPAQPRIECSSAGMSVQFQGWQAEYRPDDLQSLPTEWRGRILVGRTAGAAAGQQSVHRETRLTVSLDPAKPLTLSVQAPPNR
jgi:hypothetical protein